MASIIQVRAQRLNDLRRSLKRTANDLRLRDHAAAERAATLQRILFASANAAAAAVAASVKALGETAETSALIRRGLKELAG